MRQQHPRPEQKPHGTHMELNNTCTSRQLFKSASLSRKRLGSPLVLAVTLLYGVLPVATLASALSHKKNRSNFHSGKHHRKHIHNRTTGISNAKVQPYQVITPCNLNSNSTLWNAQRASNGPCIFDPSAFDSNRLLFTFYVALKSNTPSLGSDVAQFTTIFLNTTIMINNHYILQFIPQSQRVPINVNTLPVDNWRTSATIKPTTTSEKTYQLFLLQTNSNLVQKQTAVWWWQYQLVYASFYDNFYLPVTNPVELKTMTAVISQELQQATSSGRLQDYLKSNYSGIPLYGLVTNQNQIQGYILDPSAFVPSDNSTNTMTTTSPPEKAPVVDTTPAPSSSSSSSPLPEEYLHPLDPRSWDWLRRLGLGIFVTTFVVTCSLMSLASLRQRELGKKSIWGRLDSDDAVNKLLQTDWKDGVPYDKSSKLMGYYSYNDNDSMLIGGFEQQPCCAAVGAEITVNTTTQSETTPDTFHK
jgi:hypothetical protein